MNKKITNQKFFENKVDGVDENGEYIIKINWSKSTIYGDIILII